MNIVITISRIQGVNIIEFISYGDLYMFLTLLLVALILVITRVGRVFSFNKTPIWLKELNLFYEKWLV